MYQKGDIIWASANSLAYDIMLRLKNENKWMKSQAIGNRSRDIENFYKSKVPQGRRCILYPNPNPQLKQALNELNVHKYTESIQFYQYVLEYVGETDYYETVEGIETTVYRDGSSDSRLIKKSHTDEYRGVKIVDVVVQYEAYVIYVIYPLPENEWKIRNNIASIEKSIDAYYQSLNRQFDKTIKKDINMTKYTRFSGLLLFLCFFFEAFSLFAIIAVFVLFRYTFQQPFWVYIIACVPLLIVIVVLNIIFNNRLHLMRGRYGMWNDFERYLDKDWIPTLIGLLVIFGCGVGLFFVTNGWRFLIYFGVLAGLGCLGAGFFDEVKDAYKADVMYQLRHVGRKYDQGRQTMDAPGGRDRYLKLVEETKLLLKK